MSRVLLLNPPGRHNYIRDYFCSKRSKAQYRSAPATLLMLSGRVAERHELSVVDAIAEGLQPDQALERIARARPEAVISLVGAVCWDEDRAFLARVKERTGAYVIAIGDVLLEETTARLAEAPGVDAALLNFVTPDVLSLLPRASGEPVPNAIYRGRRPTEWIVGPQGPLHGEFSLPAPRHAAFPLKRYRFPFALRAPMSVVLTDYGCPFACSFCVLPSLGYALRPVDEVKAELRELKRLGVRELFFIDQTFGVRRERTLELLAALQEPGLSFSWSCFSRLDVTTPDLLLSMAKAGCHTIIYGVESASDELLKQYGKRLQVSQMEQTLTACQRAGIRTAATFILGLPGETEHQARATLALSLRLPLDFAAFNVAVPRAATPLRAAAAAQGSLPGAGAAMDQSGLAAAWGGSELSAEQVLRLRAEATRRFYLRPAYWLRRVAHLRSWLDLTTQVADGWSLIWEALWPGRRT